ncbi:MAG: hypothetical protein ACLRPZ_03755 [Coprococcus sp.]
MKIQLQYKIHTFHVDMKRGNSLMLSCLKKADEGVNKTMCKRNGNPKRRSKFYCLKCGREIMDGIQRSSQREKEHVKDLYCYLCKEEVKAVEVRYCDDEREILGKIPELREKYYKR